jgi:hypothetical protein
MVPTSFSRKELRLVNGKKFSLMGTPIGQELQSRPEDMPDVMNDLDIDVSEYPDLMLSFANDQRNVRKIKEAADALQLHIMNEPREGKPLLVLDLDYSELFDDKRHRLAHFSTHSTGRHEASHERCAATARMCETRVA